MKRSPLSITLMKGPTMKVANNNRGRTLDSRARRAAKKAGMRAVKSRRRVSLDNAGEFMLIDVAMNSVVAGGRHELSATEVLEICRA